MIWRGVRAALASKGVTPALDITEVGPLGIKVLYLTDPEGNAVEIAQMLSGQGPAAQDPASQVPIGQPSAGQQPAGQQPAGQGG